MGFFYLLLAVAWFANPRARAENPRSEQISAAMVMASLTWPIALTWLQAYFARHAQRPAMIILPRSRVVVSAAGSLLLLWLWTRTGP